jgi:Uma2 family endonuclease
MTGKRRARDDNPRSTPSEEAIVGSDTFPPSPAYCAKVSKGIFIMSPTKTIPRPAPTRAQAPAVAGEVRQVVPDTTWYFYDRLTDAIGDHAQFRIAFDGQDMEIVMPGFKHERLKVLLCLFIEYVSAGLKINCHDFGSTTWKRPELERGIEADASYFFDPKKLEAIRAAESVDSDNLADIPNPDLSIEIDISPSKIDRPGIYRSLQVTELWRYRDGIISIEQIDAGGDYVAAETSKFLYVRPEEVTRWVVREDASDRLAWKERLAEWVQTELNNRVVPGAKI